MINNGRIYHPWWKWECYKSNFFGDISVDVCIDGDGYKEYLGNPRWFVNGIKRLFREWPYSCEHFLTNNSINRVAWIGQATVCLELGLSYKHRVGFKLLSDEQQVTANRLANYALNLWLRKKYLVNKMTPVYRFDRNIRCFSEKIENYIYTWTKRGYANGIPDEVPNVLMDSNLAPSYKAIAQAILKNDHSLKTLGFVQMKSKWYGFFKRIEINNRSV